MVLNNKEDRTTSADVAYNACNPNNVLTACYA